MANNDGIVDRLLAPMGGAEFFEQYWNRRALHLKGPADKFRGLFDLQAWRMALPGCAVLKAGYYDADGWLRDFPIRPEQAEHLYRAGMTICASYLPETGPLGALLAGFRREFLALGRLHFNCYYSPDGHGFNLHMDDHAVFILQIEGAKTWRFSARPGVENPVRSFQFPPGRQAVRLPWGHFTRPAPESLEQVELAPGDVLFLPAGAWHEARAQGSSLALTLAFERATSMAVARAAIAARLDQAPALSDPAPVALATACGAEPDDMLRAELARLQVGLREALDGLEIADLYAAWHKLATGGDGGQPQ